MCIRDSLKNANNLWETYQTLEKIYFGGLKKAYDRMLSLADDLEGLLRPEMMAGGNAKANIFGKLVNWSRTYKWDEEPTKNLLVPLDREDFEKKYLADKKKILGVDPEDIWLKRLDAYHKLYAAYLGWFERVADPNFRLWKELRKSFPFLGLLKIVMDKREEYLKENNAVELGETSMILNAIITPSDTPFVYERMGSYLDHFLIDEFQDTSRLQWQNVQPLLDESIGRGKDNLIIGDAKQSIYRFRNAEPKLISQDVPEKYRSYIDLKKSIEGLGMNHRSDHDVVEWNNSFFEYVVGSFKNLEGVGAGKRAEDIARLYGEVRQKARYKDGGYVRVDLYEKGSSVEQTLEYILDALKRGYRMKDIAVLVRKNSNGTDMVKRLQEYNENLLEGETPLEFVSEESLIVGASQAVRQVVTVLESISHGCRPEVELDDEKNHGGAVGNIHQLELSLLLFRQEHPDLTDAECAELFLQANDPADRVKEMLSRMQTLALPALVEAITADFLQTDLRRTDAPFLAAFQDAVLEYCSSHSSDLPSFLQWWKRKASSLSISSPEDADAIRIMTIHKSKGLEFPVVILPDPLGKGKKESEFGAATGGKNWKWVETGDIKPEGLGEDKCLPDFMPVRIDKALEGTPLSGVLEEEYEYETLDNLNLIYVAMTRAIHELYVMTPKGKKDEKKDVATLGQLYGEFANVDEKVEKTEMDGVERLEYGVQPAASPSRSREKGEKGMAEAKPIPEYNSSGTPDCLRCRETSLPDYLDAEEYDIDRDNDPRSMGNVCHAIMERVIVEDDLEREIRRAAVMGLDRNSQYGGKLVTHIHGGDENVKRWFGGDAERVITERPLLKHGESLKRPDRVNIYPDGTAEVVDYKFGKVDESGKYAAQVRNYVQKLKNTGKFRHVRGWLWYVFQDKTILVSE